MFLLDFIKGMKPSPHRSDLSDRNDDRKTTSALLELVLNRTNPPQVVKENILGGGVTIRVVTSQGDYP